MPDRTLWIASEGNANDSRPNLLVQIDLTGNVIKEVPLPPVIIACRVASTSRGTLGSGFEGVAVLPCDGGAYKLLVAQQRGWDYTTDECQAIDDVDESLGAAGLNANGEPLNSRIWIYDPVTDVWTHIAWELAPLPAHAAWVGLSEITRAPDGSYVILERDNLSGDFATLKTLVRVQLDAVADNLINSGEKSVYGMLPNLKATNGWITNKPEGVAITSNGRTFVVTDNDGVEDWSGETWFLDLGRFQQLFR